MASDIHFGPALSCKVATAAMLHGLLMSIKCDSYISKLCNLTYDNIQVDFMHMRLSVNDVLKGSLAKGNS